MNVQDLVGRMITRIIETERTNDSLYGYGMRVHIQFNCGKDIILETYDCDGYESCYTIKEM